MMPMALAEGLHLGTDRASGREFFQGNSTPVDACSLFRFPSVARSAPRVGAPIAPSRIPRTRPDPELACPSKCPDVTGERKLIACTFEARWDDIIDTVSRVGYSECQIQREICAEVSKRTSIVSPVGGSGPPQIISQGNPEAMKKEKCVDVILEKKNECELTPASKDSNCTGTQGGPLTFYFDPQLGKCTAYQNLGSCDASGPFGSLRDCESAVSAKKCQ